MKNIEQHSYTVVHGVESCTQIKQDEYSHFTTVDRMNDVIHDTDYCSLCVVMSAACGLIRWKQFVTFGMCSEPRRNNPFDELGGKT